MSRYQDTCISFTSNDIGIDLTSLEASVSYNCAASSKLGCYHTGCIFFENHLKEKQITQTQKWKNCKLKHKRLNNTCGLKFGISI